MQSVGVNQYIIDAFDNGAVLKTFPYFTGDFIVTPTDAKDKQVIEHLDEKGFLVYHILPAKFVIDDQQVKMVAYLVVPKDILSAFIGNGDGLSEKVRASYIRDYIRNVISDAEYGCLYSYVVNEAWGISEFGYITVQVQNGYLLRIG
jgi:hypothetical protein